jgi:RNA polymerase sigma-70 factor (ECF subfamily)
MGQAPSTHDLARDAQRGQRNAQDALFELHRAALDHYVRTRVGSHLRARVDPDDVVQETLGRALQSLGAFQWQGEGSFLRWLKGIAFHEILRLAKRERQRAVISIEPEDVESDDPPPSSPLRREERFERLQRALDSLSPEHREVIVLARIRGMRLAEVALRTGRTPNAVAQILGRALAKLKEAFGDTGSVSLPPRSLDPSPPRGGVHGD